MQQAVQPSGTGVCGAACTQPLEMLSAQKLITICANSRQARENDFAVSLAVAEGDIEW
jgi:hypothetical protein